MHDLLAAAVEDRERSLAHGAAFADGHGASVRRTVQVRRVAAYAGTGTVAAVATVGVGFGVHAWAGSGHMLSPAGSPSAPAGTLSGSPSTSPSVTPSNAPEVGGSRTVTLVQVPIDESVYLPGESDREYVYYATLGEADMVPFPGGGIWYPGIADVPADAFIVSLNGDPHGYDIDAPGAVHTSIGAFSLASDQGDLIGDRSPYAFEYTADGQNASITWDVVGYVSSTTQWGVHYFLVDGKLVTEVEGRSNPAAIEVTAMFDPQSAS